MRQPITKLLIANRGEIACRIIRTARDMGIATVAVYSSADAGALHVEMADERIHIGPPPAAESYLVGARIIEAALRAGAEAIHPGYGFLSENPEFVEAVEAAGLIFVGPSAKAIRAMGLKDAAKDLMVAADVPVVPGYQGSNQEPAFLASEAAKIGFPVLIKARAGGGGKGMRLVERPKDFADALAAAQREGQAAFGDGHVLVEKFIASPRHIEVQVFGDTHGNVVHLFERDCSLQRRHQKVIEEAPAPDMTEPVRAAITAAAVKAARAIDYSGAGTIEFIADGSGPLRADGFWFMEMNTRLQVEHPVTEAVTGIDLVEWQLRVAGGAELPCTQEALTFDGHAFEARLYAEDPSNGFLPATGTLEQLAFHGAARNDSGVRRGDVISPHYDPMIAKVIVHGKTRQAALDALYDALTKTHVAGTPTNKQFLTALARHKGFAAGSFDTGLIERDLESLIRPQPPGPAHLAFAAIAALGLRPDRPHFGFRLWGAAQHEANLSAGGETFALRLNLGDGGRATMECGGEETTLADIETGPGTISARFGATEARVVASVNVAQSAAGRAVSVMIDGVTHELSMGDSRNGQRLSGSDQSDAVLAPMTGQVVSVLVAAGDTVAQGTKLGIMEAMKMETTLTAPRDATIATVLCATGDAVEGGAPLFLFEPESPS